MHWLWWFTYVGRGVFCLWSGLVYSPYVDTLFFRVGRHACNELTMAAHVCRALTTATGLLDSPARWKPNFLYGGVPPAVVASMGSNT